MFRKIQDRVVAAASSAMNMVNNTNNNNNTNTSTNRNDIHQLQALGDYTIQEIEFALHATNGNVDRAAEILLSSSSSMSQPTATVSQQQQQQHHMSPSSSSSSIVTHENNIMDDDQELQQALHESLQFSQPQHNRTSIMNQAADAAIRRAEVSSKGFTKKKNTSTSNTKHNSTTSTQTTTEKVTNSIQQHPPSTTIRLKSQSLIDHHPNVQIIPKLQDKSLEEQIIRTVDRMKNHAAAIDTLHRAISMIYQYPNEMKYRTIDTSTSAYQKNIANVPGTFDFLRAMKFYTESSSSSSTKLVLSQSMYDPAVLYLGISALDQMKLSSEYTHSKIQLSFIKDVTKLIQQSSMMDTLSMEERKIREQYTLKCPKEPIEGRNGALLQVYIMDGYILRRRFDSDDTILDVIYWICSILGSIMYHNIMNGTWYFIDMNHTNRIPINVIGVAQHYTLQYIGCWPSGRLQLQPSTTTITTTTMNASEQQQQSTSISTTSQRWNNHHPNKGLSRGLASGTLSSSDDE